MKKKKEWNKKRHPRKIALKSKMAKIKKSKKKKHNKNK